MSAATRLRVPHGGLGSRPAKYMLYSASSLFSSDSSRFRSRSVSEAGGTGDSPPQQEPDQRQPQLAGVGHRPVVDQHLGRIRGADDLKQLAQADRLARPEAPAIAGGPPRARLPEIA